MELSPAFARFVSMVAERGAYAVITDAQGRVLIGEDQNGDCRLPGGRQEPGESPRDALTREAREEVGYRIRIGQPLGRIPVVVRDGAGLVLARFYRGTALEIVNDSPEYRPWWMTRDDAARNLHRDGDRQALEWDRINSLVEATATPLLAV